MDKSHYLVESYSVEKSSLVEKSPSDLLPTEQSFPAVTNEVAVTGEVELGFVNPCSLDATLEILPESSRGSSESLSSIGILPPREFQEDPWVHKTMVADSSKVEYKEDQSSKGSDENIWERMDTRKEVLSHGHTKQDILVEKSTPVGHEREGAQKSSTYSSNIKPRTNVGMVKTNPANPSFDHRSNQNPDAWPVGNSAKQTVVIKPKVMINSNLLFVTSFLSPYKLGWANCSVLSKIQPVIFFFLLLKIYCYYSSL